MYKVIKFTNRLFSVFTRLDVPPTTIYTKYMVTIATSNKQQATSNKQQATSNKQQATSNN
ncbi:MAG: hypothetical protein Ta2B_14830 [Termitinemataceae bacterium]|nr:MAG: hypothetical protein Ta2B_14830 [Termitinemataceae bacterium]